MVSLPEMERKHVPIQKAYLLSCVNARFEDLHDAAEVIRARGGRVADGVEFYLAPASAEVQARVRVQWRLANAGRCRRNSAAARLRRVHRPRSRSRAKRRDRNQRDESQFQRPHGRSRRVRVSRFARCRRRQRAGWIHLRADKLHRARRRHRDSTRLKRNRGQRRRCRSWKVFPPSVRGRFSSSTKTI